MKRRILFVIFFMLILSFTASAEEISGEFFYKEQYEISGAGSLQEYLPEEVEKSLDKGGIEPSDINWVNNITAQNVFSHIWGFLKSGGKTVFSSAAALLSIILISGACENMELKTDTASLSNYATTLSVAAVITAPVLATVKASVNAMQGCAVFMMAFIPVFAAIVAACGSAITSVSMSALLLGAAQAVNYIANFVVIPLLGGYTAISIASSVSPVVSSSGVAEGIKKLSFWIMSLVTTVFIGILSIQTAVNASADTLSLKTAKFIIGSAVPVAGTALSEALTTVTASMGMLRSSVGIYGVVACSAIFLPLLAELLIWRVVLVLSASISDLFSLGKISALLRSVDTVMSVLMGIILLTCTLFIISLTVVVTAGKG